MEGLSLAGHSALPTIEEIAPPGRARPAPPFSARYDKAQALRYLQRHKGGIARRISFWRESAMLQQALRLAGNPSTILDLATGAGRLWPLLLCGNPRLMGGADISHDMLLTGLNQHSEFITKKVKLFQASAFALPLRDAAVEAVFCVRFLHHIGSSSERTALLREMARVSSRSVCLSLWVDGNYKSLRRRKKEARLAREDHQNRFVVAPREIESDFRTAGLEPVARVNLLRFYSMWTTYVLRKV